jgi:hypothetical protein
MRFGKLLDIIGAAHEGIMIKLLIPDLHHVKDYLGILRIVFVPTVVQSLSCSGYSWSRAMFVAMGVLPAEPFML